MAPDDNDWRKDELNFMSVCVCVCETDKLTKKRGKDLQRLWEFLNRGIIFFGGVLFLTQNFIV